MKLSKKQWALVVLALIAERAAGTSFHDLVRDVVCTPAGLGDNPFLRPRAPPTRSAGRSRSSHGTGAGPLTTITLPAPYLLVVW